MPTIALLTAVALARADRRQPVDWMNPNVRGIGQLLVPTYPTTSLPNGMLRVYPQRESFASAALSGRPLAVTGRRGGSSLTISSFAHDPRSVDRARDRGGRSVARIGPGTRARRSAVPRVAGTIIPAPVAPASAILGRMKKLAIPALVVAATLAVSFAPAQVTVNGKRPKVVKAVKVKDAKTVRTVGPKRHRRKFLGIF